MAIGIVRAFGRPVIWGFLAGTLALSACNSSGTNNVEDTLDVSQQQMAGVPQISVPQIDEVQDPRGICPKTIIREGTESFDVYPAGIKKGDEGAASRLRWRATITEVARECNSAGGGAYLNIRVGVRGRYLSGPKGETGAFTMPVRIALTRGDEVLYSQLHEIPAEILPGRTNGVFSYLDEAISIPMPERDNVRIYVGYDEGPYDTP